MSKLTPEQIDILGSADHGGYIEPEGRYKRCDAMARQGLLMHIGTEAPSRMEPVEGPQRRYSYRARIITKRTPMIRTDIFRLTDAGKAALATTRGKQTGHSSTR
jgi:hypothetical protein